MNAQPAGDGEHATSFAPRSRLALVAILALAALVRAPYFVRVLGAGVDGDTAIVGLMARHTGQGTTLWGQPYGSPVDSWAAAPFVATLGTTHLAVRLPVFLLGLALVPLAALLAREIDPAAALPAALLAAVPPSYLLMLSALAPPLYATTLALLATVLVLTLRLRARAEATRAPWAALAGFGIAGGLAIWTHLMSLTVVGACAGLVAWAWRRRPAAVLAALLPLLLTSAPWWVRVPGDPSSLWALSAIREGQAAWGRIGGTIAAMHRPLLVTIGARVPFTPDNPEVLAAPAWVTVLLLLVYAVGAVAALRLAWRRPEGRVLLAAIVLVVLVFPLPVRSGPDTPRFLTPLFVPMAVLAAAGVARRRIARWGLPVAAAALHLALAARLLAAWNVPGAEISPDCRGVRQELARLGVTRAYASYDTAYCLTYESGETIVASQPWNERFFGYPMPYLDDVRFAREAAWVLVPGADFALPSPRHFESALRAAGGAWGLDRAGDAVILHSFVPPFPPDAAPLAGAGPAGDGRLETRIVYPARGPVTFVLADPASPSAVTLIAAVGDRRLPGDFTLEVSADGVAFERVFRRRADRALMDLYWINGHPQHVVDPDYLTVRLDGRRVAALRIIPAGASDWALEEVLLHPSGPAAPWDDWMPVATTWPERRRALEATPRPARADWYYRRVLASRHP